MSTDISLHLSESDSENSVSQIREKIEWELIREFESEQTFKLYLSLIDHSIVTTHNNHCFCNICEINDDSHKMIVKYKLCTTDECHENDEDCKFQLRTRQCVKSNKCQIFTYGQHNSISAIRKQHGISPDLKQYIINTYLKIDSSITALKVRSKLTQNKELIGAQHPALYDFVVPNLKKIQNVISYYRSKEGNNNLVDEAEKFLNDYYIKPEDLNDLSDSKTFVFGPKLNKNNQPVIGTGIDENHLNVLMTSKKLFKRLFEDLDQPSLYHLDATHKITKNGFPLVIFGRSDIHRVFHPICFMLTSHETESDFFYLFDEIKKLAKHFGHDFKPDFILTDACKASLKAIKSCFEKAKTLMCWFHLKYNVSII
jgi:hypothetical protein